MRLPMNFRALNRDEIADIWTIERSELIEHI
jgi:hypothetical protein